MTESSWRCQPKFSCRHLAMWFCLRLGISRETHARELDTISASPEGATETRRLPLPCRAKQSSPDSHQGLSKNVGNESYQGDGFARPKASRGQGATALRYREGEHPMRCKRTPRGADATAQLALQGEKADAGLLLPGMVGASDQWPRFHMPEAEG